MSSSTAPAYPNSAGGSAPGVATTIVDVSGTRAATLPPTDCRTGVWGNAFPSSSAVRSAPTIGRGRGAIHRSGTPSRPRPAAPPATARRPGLLVVRAGTGRSAAGSAPRRLPAALADQRDQIARPRCLDQHRALRQGSPDQFEDLVRQPGGPRRRVTLQGEVGVGGHLHLWGGVPDRGPVLGQFGQPAPFQPALQFRGPRVAGEHRAGAGLGGAEGQHLPGVRIRGSLLTRRSSPSSRSPTRPRSATGPCAVRGCRSPPGPHRGGRPGTPGNARPVRFGPQQGEARPAKARFARLPQPGEVPLVRDDDDGTAPALGAARAALASPAASRRWSPRSASPATARGASGQPERAQEPCPVG